MLKITEIRCCGLKNPIGLKYSAKICFSWKLASDRQEVVQKTCRVRIYAPEQGRAVRGSTRQDSGACDRLVWDSKVQESPRQEIEYDGENLKSNTKYRYEVWAEDPYGDSAVDASGSFTLGITQKEWKAKWIGVRENPEIKAPGKEELVKAFRAMTMAEGEESGFTPDRALESCKVYRKRFVLKEVPKEGWLSITSHGVYDARINGKPVTDTRMNPGFTVYDRYLEYQTYDVASLLKAGENVITVILADGWYRGKYGLLGCGNNYGTKLALLAQLEIRYPGADTEWIVTDETFSYKESAYSYSDILIGEKQDARVCMEEIYTGRDGDQGWRPAKILDYGYETLCGICCEPVRCTQILPAKEVFHSPKGELIVDMGQNITGAVRLKAKGPAGTEIKLEHSEVLDKEGNFINNIIGVNRDQTDYYILSGKGEETFEPLFTFHGFRYVKVSGYPGTLTADQVQGVVLGSDLEESGEFRCSDERLNRLQSNIQWSQRGNMLSIPMDCPQRERAGWTGDILVYGRTAAYNQNVKNFLEKWLENMELEQFENGLIPIIVPYPLAYSAMQMDVFGRETSAGWGDAAVAVPWILYQAYGDIRILKKNFGMMKKWMDYVEQDASGNILYPEKEMSAEQAKRQKYLWNTGFHFGDWCYPSCRNEKGETDMFQSAMRTKEYVAPTMYAHSAGIMSEVCGALGKEELAEHYRQLNQKIRDAFSAEYIRPDGSIPGATQGIYVLALAFGMGTSEQLDRMAGHLNRMIQENGGCLDTGFMSIPWLMDVLNNYGYKKTARRLLYQEKCPSWLYEVKNGATTMWETWNAVQEDGTRSSCSYNHYAFGCIGDWMYRKLLGIQNAGAGYEKIRIEPDFGYGLSEAEGSYECIYGKIGCKWKFCSGKGKLWISIPVGTKADVVLPGRAEHVGSGEYEFEFGNLC